MKNYSDLSDSEKFDIIKTKYLKEKKSFGAIAKELNTYRQKIDRDARKFKIPVRNRSEAMKNAINSGLHPHPTKGKKRTDQEKEKIGLGVFKNWQKADDKKIKEKSRMAKKNWENRTEKNKKDMTSKGNLAVRESSKVGSKMEHYILDDLISKGYKVDFHKEQILANTRLQIDLFLPKINIAIEVDGPSHFAPVWGEESLARNKTYDKKKSGLIVGKGYKLIRIKQTKDFSKSRAIIVCEKLHKVLENINSRNSKIIEIEDK